jgi:hypothetical protein
MRLLFAVCTFLLSWSLLTWWGTAFGPRDHYKFGALGAAKVLENDKQERCSWYFAGPHDAHCRPRDAVRLSLLQMGAPLLFGSLLASLLGTFEPRGAFVVFAAISLALAIAAIVFNAEAGLAFSAGQAVELRGTGLVAAVLAWLVMVLGHGGRNLHYLRRARPKIAL